MANRLPALLVLFLFAFSSLTHVVTQEQKMLEASDEIHASSGSGTSTDVPSWRIGDKWTYETKFDVAQLIAQANVSASLNTLTGDTVYEVADILFVTTNGVQNLVYTLNISGEFSSASNSDAC